MLAIFSMMVALIISERALLTTQPPHNPFADFAPLMPGQLDSTAITLGFSCISIPNDRGAMCANKPAPERSLFFEIDLSVSSFHRIERASFITDRLVIGDLLVLWGQPAGQMKGSLVVVICWPDVYALSPLNGQRSMTYFSPVKMVEFSRGADRMCLPQGGRTTDS
jgi:hypothetical protein